MAWAPKIGRSVTYRNAQGRIFHAVITAVTNQTTVTLRIGSASNPKKVVVAGATKVARRSASAGWWH